VAYAASPSHGPDKAIAELRQVLQLEPSFARAHVALGKALLQSGQVAPAVEALQEAVRLEPDSGEANYQLGLALARAGKKEEAAAALAKGRELVAAADRDQSIALDLAEGRAAMSRGEHDRAVARFQHAVRLRPDAAEAQRLLGSALDAKGDTAGAVAAYRKAAELNPADTDAKDAVTRLTSATASTPGTATAGTPGAARASASAATPGGDDAALVAQVEGYIRDSKFAEAEPLLAEYVKTRPSSSWGWYALGYSLFAQQKIGEAIKALATSLQLDLHNAEAHKILGRTLMIIGRFDAARTEFEAGLRDKPDSAELHYNLGKLASIQDDWPTARASFEAALRIDPNYLEAIDALGFALEALGDDQGAVAHYQKAIALNAERKGSFASAHVSLSAYYNRTDQPDKALELAEAAIELDPKSDRAWFQKARADERQGRFTDAVSALNEAIKLNAHASSYYYVLAGVYRRLGWNDDSKEALQMFTRLERESRELDEKRRRAGGSAAPSPPRP